jgi:hypothetical protein
MDLGAIDYLHFGHPKVWYVVADKYAVKLENSIVEVLSKKGLIKKPCDFILGHKDYIVTPQFLRDHNIKHTVIFQKAGEFELTFPRAYHQGLNLGFNLAEDTNFGNKQWIKFGQMAKQCSCSRVDSPFSMDLFIKFA